MPDANGIGTIELRIPLLFTFSKVSLASIFTDFRGIPYRLSRFEGTSKDLKNSGCKSPVSQCESLTGNRTSDSTGTASSY